MIAKTSFKERYENLQGSSTVEEQGWELMEVLQKVVLHTSELLEVRSCFLALLDATGTLLVTQAVLPGTEDAWRSTRFHLNEGVVGWVAAQRETLLINDMEGDVHYKRPAGVPVGSLLCVPLLHNTLLIGTLAVSSQQRDTFTPRDIRLLEIFAAQATLSIVQVRQTSQARQQISQLESMRTHFYAMMAHTLRSPLNGINGYLELLLADIGGGLNVQQREFVQRARSSSEHLYALLENALLIARVDAGQLCLSREVVSLPTAVGNAIEELELTALDQKATIHVDVPTNLPYLYADTLRLQQMLRNLLSNALRFTEDGGSVTISASVEKCHISREDILVPERGGEVVKLQVSDTGIGIAPEFQRHIFDRYFQHPSLGAGRTAGQGLGLACVKTIVELHGGAIEVESVPKHGSTFTCILPCLSM